MQAPTVTVALQFQLILMVCLLLTEMITLLGLFPHRPTRRRMFLSCRLILSVLRPLPSQGVVNGSEWFDVHHILTEMGRMEEARAALRHAKQDDDNVYNQSTHAE